MVDFRRLRLTRLLLKTLLIMLGICALFGIYALIAGNLGSVETIVLLFCLAAAYHSLTGLGCAAALDRDLWRRFALLGICTSVVSFLTTGIAILEAIDFDDGWKFVVILWMLSALSGYASLLTIPKLTPNLQWTRLAAIGSASIAVFTVSAMLVFEPRGIDDDIVWQVVGIFSILAVLGTVAVPILARMSALQQRITGPDDEPPESIHVVCPRCHRREEVLIGAGDCSRCGLGINVQLSGWEARQQASTVPERV